MIKMQPTAEAPGKKFHHRIAVSILAFLVLLTYANILNNELFLDDLDFIVNNAFIRDWRYFARMFTESMVSGAGKTSDYYRPMMQVFFTFGYSLWELNPMGYHLFSILFHALNAVLLYCVLAKLLKVSLPLVQIVHP